MQNHPMRNLVMLIACSLFSIYLQAQTQPKTNIAELEVKDSSGTIEKAGEHAQTEGKFVFQEREKIASFSEKDITGTRFNLKELAGKIVVLNFWFINCGPCRQEMPDLNEVVEEYKNNPNVVFIAFSLDEKYSIKEFLKTNPFQYNIIDNSRFISEKYGINSYPTHVVLDREGKVLFHTTGLAMNTVSWVKKSIDDALKATTPQ